MSVLFLIDDCEIFYISAENEGAALQIFAEYHGFDDIGLFLEDSYGGEETIEAVRVDDNKVLKFRIDEDGDQSESKTASKTAKEWAAEVGGGLVASSLY